ncbi:hypothetical protein CSQ93_00670 [Janthinobacterium sp. BJB426]|uniref:GumC family protein n=1 Tax=Janthinobacterium sp. BJB426 TaxID=2048010 RepID=UPI000C112F80|nr:GNVR domain-containing protein [Janthinobacterium sp. BJB426]PHV29687.1 hypothetical protein CSQ93_00670 [Janthinobacterium sp. BJB426]
MAIENMDKEATMTDKNNLQDNQMKVDGRSDQIDFLDMAIVIVKNKKNIIFSVFFVMFVAAGMSLLIANKYTARTQLLPPQSQSSSNALLGQLGALSGLTGGASALKNPNDIYIGMLNSRTVSDKLIERFKLQSIYDVKLKSDARNSLQQATNIVNGKDGLIFIEVTDEDPKLAANLANAYVEELQNLTKILAVTEASQRRLFFERQLQQVKVALGDAEVALKQVQEKTGLIKLNEQAEATIQAAAAIKAQMASKEVALGAMRIFSTSNNPDYIKIQQELFGLRSQLNKLETGLNMGKGDISISTSSVPELGLEYTRRVRDVKYQETIFEMLAKQLEISKVDEAKEGSILQVLDGAIAPDKKSKPARSIIVIFSGFLAAIFSIFWAFLADAFRNSTRDPRNLKKFQQFKMFCKWGSNKVK